jgi:uncharacterized protein YdbL (DUF1318 family)
MKRLTRDFVAFPVFTIVLLAVAACVTINVYFPEKAIEDLSQQIEDEVQKRAAEIESDQPQQTAPESSDSPDERSANHPGPFELLLGVTPVHAAEVPAPEVSNPAIRKIIEARAERAGRIDEFKSLGVIGENNEALLEILALDRLEDLRQRSEVQKLVRMENEDRERLYREIAGAKNVDLSQLPRIRETYAATLRANARPGDWIQSPGGDWKQK